MSVVYNGDKVIKTYNSTFRFDRAKIIYTKLKERGISDGIVQPNSIEKNDLIFKKYHSDLENNNITKKQFLRGMLNVIKTLRNLISKGVYHQDIKLGNIVTDRKFKEFRFIDFDLTIFKEDFNDSTLDEIDDLFDNNDYYYPDDAIYFSNIESAEEEVREGLIQLKTLDEYTRYDVFYHKLCVYMTGEMIKSFFNNDMKKYPRLEKIVENMCNPNVMKRWNINRVYEEYENYVTKFKFF